MPIPTNDASGWNDEVMTASWFTEQPEGHSEWYAEHFRELVASGEDVEGEARFMNAVVPPASRILDAGCGQGRTASALFALGHQVLGIDIDPVLIAAAEVDHPGPKYLLADLATLDLPNDLGLFDGAISAGNVITFVTPGSHVQVLASVHKYLKADAPYVLGFHTERLDVDEFDGYAKLAGFELDNRFSTWDLRPWRDDSDFAVTILRSI
jgi:SAM-dependent methyltransferase